MSVEKQHSVKQDNHLHLPLLDVGRLSVATEEAFVVRPHQARERTQQQLEKDKDAISFPKMLFTHPSDKRFPLTKKQMDS